MDEHQRSLRLGAAVIACAVMLRLAGGGLFQKAADFLVQPDISSFLIYLETGRIVRFSQSVADAVFARESAAPAFAEQIPEAPPVFLPEDAEGIRVKYGCSLRPDLGELIARPLDWDLTGETPSVLILHTHATESYTKGESEDYEESSAFRTLDEGYNMLSVGSHLARLLEEGGIKVIHDRELHDYPSYNGSYSHARKSVAEYLREYPSIRLVLDLHRDASGDNESQMKTGAMVDGMPSAQLMLVIGTDASALEHEKWEENLALGLKLHVQMERISPGIMRYVNLRGQRFNQDLSPGMLLVEVGAAGDSRDEALRAVEVLAEGILALAKGSNIPAG